jgi:lipoprotein-releasing system ATP-binding protein
MTGDEFEHQGGGRPRPGTELDANLATRNSQLATSILRAEGLSKVYGRGERAVRVFEGLGLEVRAGEMVAIVGPSGAGKSSLLHILGGLDRPTSGTVEVAKFDIAQLSDVDLARFRNRKIGFIFQFHHLLPEFTALENTMMPLLIGGIGRRESRARAVAVLERVGLSKRLDHRPGELSGGEAQRVALARALVHGPRVLLADEPTGNLDQRTGDAIHGLLKSVHAAEGLTSIIVTHNERLAASCDRVLHLEDGGLRAV